MGSAAVRCKHYRTTLEVHLELDNPARFPRKGLSIQTLKRVAGAMSDTEAARRMQQAKDRLFTLWRTSV